MLMCRKEKKCRNCLPSHKNCCINTISINTVSLSVPRLDSSQDQLANCGDSALPSQNSFCDGSTHLNHLLSFRPLPLSMDDAYKSTIQSSYDQVVNWRSNLFPLLLGNAATMFVEKLAKLFNT